jgi:hypothetical protein
MQGINDKYQFKNNIGKILADFGISHEMYEKVFAYIFLEIFEKHKQYSFIFSFYKINIIEQIIWEINDVKKHKKENLLLLLEDYQKLNNELNELVLKIKKDCVDESGQISPDWSNIIDITKYPMFYGIVENKDLRLFKADLITSPLFLEFISTNLGKYGLYFLYNLNKELLFVGKSTNLGSKIIDKVWERNIDGYVAVAYTNTKSDIHVYEPYYIISEKPLLNVDIVEDDNLSLSLDPLQKCDFIKIYENN